VAYRRRPHFSTFGVGWSPSPEAPRTVELYQPLSHGARRSYQVRSVVFVVLRSDTRRREWSLSLPASAARQQEG
jgi:hypothetical protein